MLNASRRYNNTSYTTEYGSFRGADFSSPMNDIDKTRSPDALNVLVGAGGNLIKRPGIQALWNAGSSYKHPVFGIFSAREPENGMETLFVHCGNRLYRIYLYPFPDAEILSSDMPMLSSVGLQYGRYMLFFTGAGYLCYDMVQNEMRDVHDCAYAPLVVVNASPATGSGTAYEAVNDLTGARRVTYLGDGATTEYALQETAFKVEKVFVQRTAGNWETTGWTFDDQTNKITFTVAPPAPFTAGQPTVLVKYRVRYSGEDRDNSLVAACKYAGLCGIGGNGAERIFAAGNQGAINRDWHSDIVDTEYLDFACGLPEELASDTAGLSENAMPFYFPDTGYATVGSPSSGILGYARIGAYQVVVKEESNTDAGIYLRSGGVDDDGNAVFTLEPGIAGVGAVAPKSIANFLDEPLFLTRGNGVCGIDISGVKQFASIVNRSWFLDGKLKQERGPENALACVFNGYYLLSVNGAIYVLDGRQSRTYREHSRGYVYEGYLWFCQHIRATALAAGKDNVFIGDEQGVVYRVRFDLDENNPARYRDDWVTV